MYGTAKNNTEVHVEKPVIHFLVLLHSPFIARKNSYKDLSANAVLHVDSECRCWTTWEKNLTAFEPPEEISLRNVLSDQTAVEISFFKGCSRKENPALPKDQLIRTTLLLADSEIRNFDKLSKEEKWNQEKQQ